MAERKAYSVFVIPAAYKTAINVALALVNGDDPSASESCSVPANPTGNWEDPETHYYGGMPSNEAWEAVVSNLSTSMAAGAWPINGISEADAMAAAEQMHLQITVTQDGTPPSPQTTLANALTALGLQKITYPF